MTIPTIAPALILHLLNEFELLFSLENLSEESDYRLFLA
jgi:hypothetical protein